MHHQRMRRTVTVLYWITGIAASAGLVIIGVCGARRDLGHPARQPYRPDRNHLPDGPAPGAKENAK